MTDDEELARVLSDVAARQSADPAFRERLARQLAETATAANATTTNTTTTTTPATTAAARAAAAAARPGLPRPNRRQPLTAALAFAAAAGLLWLAAPRGGRLGPMPPPSVTLPDDAPARVTARPAERAVVAFAPRGSRAGAPAPLRLELRDGAAVAFRPGQPPALELSGGFVRVAAEARVRVRAADEEMLMQPGSEAAFELVRAPEKGEPMRSVWLIPSSAASGAALTLAVLVARGDVELGGRGRAAPGKTGDVLVLHPAEGVQGAAAANRRVNDLEQKVTALRQENGRLAGQLAQKKGVTVQGVLERIDALKSSPYAAFLAPGAVTDLLSDLRGLGPAGVEAMVKLLKSPNPNLRFLAAKLLEDLSAPDAIPALRQAALTDTDKLAANMASHALALMDDAGTVPALREIADAKGAAWEARVNALWGLCKHGDQKAIGEALAFVKDDKQTAQARAGLGANLALLHDPELMPIVDETVKEYGKAPQVGAVAVAYYKSVGTPEAHERLAAMAKDPKLDESVRQAAREALAK